MVTICQLSSKVCYVNPLAPTSPQHFIARTKNSFQYKIFLPTKARLCIKYNYGCIIIA